jgi:hypothetical protein
MGRHRKGGKGPARAVKPEKKKKKKKKKNFPSFVYPYIVTTQLCLSWRNYNV